MTAQSVTVLLEPPERASMDREREALIADIDPRLQEPITNAAHYAIVADIESRVSAYLARVEPIFDEHCAAAHKVWKSATDIRGRFLAGPRAMKLRARALMSEYTTREEQERRERERKIAQEEFQRSLERQQAEAQLLRDSNQPELAAVVESAAIEAAPVTLPSAVPEIDGLTYREDWYWLPVGGDTPANRVKALSMFVRPEFLPFVQLSDGGLTAFARRTKGTIKVPGIQFRMRKVPVRR